MQFESTHITGKGRGKPMGFPTINLKIPDGFKLKEGIYAAKVTIEDKKFIGALHFGPIPTFAEQEKSLEVYLISANDDLELENLDGKIIKVEIVKYLRKIIKFQSVSSLVKQIEADVKQIKTLIN
jgi:riboflavin kinase/FMN adenylyltransferase